MLRAALLLALFASALLLSFSRGAWGQCAFAAIVLMALTFVTSRSPVERLRIALFAVLGLAGLAAFITALLSIDQVADLFYERASLEQSYDVGRLRDPQRRVPAIPFGQRRPGCASPKRTKLDD